MDAVETANDQMAVLRDRHAQLEAISADDDLEEEERTELNDLSRRILRERCVYLTEPMEL